VILEIGTEDLVEYSFSVILVITIFGLLFGSFISMLVYRLPLGISLFNPKRSSCPNCKYTIKWYENIPILSYIFLKGKCANCKDKISIIYPIIEFTTVTITLLLFINIGLNIEFLTITLLFYTLITLSFIDFKYKAVPDYLLILALIIASFSANFDFQSALMFAGGFVILELFITYYIQNIKAKILKDDSLKDQVSLGEGDIPIVAIIGGVLGIKLALIGIMLSAFLAIIPAILNSFIKKDIETPFIPYLSLALLLVYLNQELIINSLTGQYSI